jgi:hypothetical protein
MRTQAWGARGRGRLGETGRRPHLVLILGVDDDGQHKGRYSQREHEVLKPATRPGELLQHARPEHRPQRIQRSLHRQQSPSSCSRGVRGILAPAHGLYTSLTSPFTERLFGQ